MPLSVSIMCVIECRSLREMRFYWTGQARFNLDHNRWPSQTKGPIKSFIHSNSGVTLCFLLLVVFEKKEKVLRKGKIIIMVTSLKCFHFRAQPDKLVNENYITILKSRYK